MIFAGLLLPLVLGGAQLPAQGSHVPQPCIAGTREVERTLRGFALNETRLAAFERVAAVRREAGLDVLPGMLGCPSIGTAAAKVGEHPASVKALAAAGVDARTFISTGWALVVSSESDGTGLTNEESRSDMARRNAAFVSRWKLRVRRLLFSD